MAAMEAIRLPAMLVLSALLAVLVVWVLVSGAWNAAGGARATAHRVRVNHAVASGARTGAAPVHGLGRTHAQRHSAWSVARGRPPRAVRFEVRGTSSRS
jgi:hypothetical protein